MLCVIFLCPQENSTMCASARLDGLVMVRFVDLTGTSMAGPTLTCPAKKRDVGWTIALILQTLVKRIATVMALAMLATMTQTMMESQIHPTTALLSQTLTNSTQILMAKTCEETPATTVHFYPTLISKTQTKMDWEMIATLTRITMEF